jgi:YD repeat-containing protein
VVRDASGRIVQTIERQKQAGGAERAVTRDASGRIVGTSPGSGKCQKPGLVPLPPSSTKK